MNIQLYNNMTQEQILTIAHNHVAVPAMLILYSIFGIGLFFTGWAFKESNSSWGRFFWIWTTTMLLTGVFLIFLIYSPNSVQLIATKFMEMMS